MGSRNNPSETIITRRDFLHQGAGALLSLTAIGCMASCMTKLDPDDAKLAEPFKPVTLSAAQKSTLDTNGFLNITGAIVIKDGAAYRAYSRTCPHESGDVVAQSATSFQCQRHTDQFYNNVGQGNGARTSASLAQYTVTDNAGTLTVS